MNRGVDRYYPTIIQIIIRQISSIFILIDVEIIDIIVTESAIDAIIVDVLSIVDAIIVGVLDTIVVILEVVRVYLISYINLED